MIENFTAVFYQMPEKEKGLSKGAQGFFLITLILLSIVLNGIVALVIGRNKRIQTPGNLFVLSLTAANFFSSCVMFLEVTSSLGHGGYALGGVVCEILGFVHLICLACSSAVLAMISMDRYYAIVKPMVYNTEITTTRSIYSLILCWTVSLLISVPPFWGWSQFIYQPHLFMCWVAWNHHATFTAFTLSFSYLFPFICMLTCYIYIYFAARLQHRSVNIKIRQESPSFKSKRQIKLLQKLPWVIPTYNSPHKALRTVGYLLGSFTITWATYIVWIVCEFLGRGGAVFAFSAFYVLNLGMISNPLLYGFMNRTIRKRIRALFCGGDTVISKYAISTPTQERKISVERKTSGASSTSFASFMDFLPRRLSYMGGIDSFDLLKMSRKNSENEFVQRFRTISGNIRQPVGRTSSNSLKRRCTDGSLRKCGTAPGSVYYPSDHYNPRTPSPHQNRRGRLLQSPKNSFDYSGQFLSAAIVQQISTDSADIPLEMEVEDEATLHMVLRKPMNQVTIDEHCHTDV